MLEVGSAGPITSRIGGLETSFSLFEADDNCNLHYDYIENCIIQHYLECTLYATIYCLTKRNVDVSGACIKGFLDVLLVNLGVTNCATNSLDLKIRDSIVIFPCLTVFSLNKWLSLC